MNLPEINRETDALIVVDVQNDFCPGGSLAVDGGDEVVPVINDLMDAFDTVVATRDYHVDPEGHFAAEPDFADTWPEHCVVGTDGAQYHPDLNVGGVDAEFLKGEYTAAYSGFEAADKDGNTLAQYLRQKGVTRVFICGLATDHCVKATVLDARNNGFITFVLLGAARGVAPETTEEAVRQMHKAGATVVE